MGNSSLFANKITDFWLQKKNKNKTKERSKNILTSEMGKNKEQSVSNKFVPIKKRVYSLNLNKNVYDI